MDTFDLSSIPQAIRGLSAWFGPQMEANREWIEQLAPSEIAEIEEATDRVVRSEKALPSLTADDFPLPTLRPRLRRILDDVLNGRGFVLMRGLPVQRWTRQQSATAFFGLGTHLGNARMQNAAGHVLGHVRDLGMTSRDPNVRIYQTSERQGYHTDSCDIVGLLCLQTAKTGGFSSLVSSVTVFNEMRRTRPDLLPYLMEPIATDRRGEFSEGQKPYFEIPVFNWHAGLLSAIYQRKYIDSARRLVGEPLTPQQVEALDCFDSLCNDPRLFLSMEFRPGDVQWVHNHTLLHDRTAFEDWIEPERKRHLLRLWLAPLEARPLPPVFAQRYGSIEPGDRGGMSIPGTKPIAPLE